MNSVVKAEIVSGDTRIAGTEMAATPTQVQANFQIPTTAAPGSRWDVVVTDDAGRTAALPRALQVTAAPSAPVAYTLMDVTMAHRFLDGSSLSGRCGCGVARTCSAR